MDTKWRKEFKCTGGRVAPKDADGHEIWQLWRIDGKYAYKGKFVYGVQYWDNTNGRNDLCPVDVEQLKEKYPTQVESWESTFGDRWEDLYEDKPILWNESDAGSQATDSEAEEAGEIEEDADQQREEEDAEDMDDDGARTPTGDRSNIDIESLTEETQIPPRTTGMRNRKIVPDSYEEEDDENEDSLLTIRAPNQGTENEQEDEQEDLEVIEISDDDDDEEPTATPAAATRSVSVSSSQSSSSSKRIFHDSPRKARQSDPKKAKVGGTPPGKTGLGTRSQSSSSKRDFDDSPRKARQSDPKKAKKSTGGGSRASSGSGVSAADSSNDPFAISTAVSSGASRAFRLPVGYPSGSSTSSLGSPTKKKLIRPQARVATRGVSPSLGRSGSQTGWTPVLGGSLTIPNRSLPTPGPPRSRARPFPAVAKRSRSSTYDLVDDKDEEKEEEDAKDDDAEGGEGEGEEEDDIRRGRSRVVKDKEREELPGSQTEDEAPTEANDDELPELMDKGKGTAAEEDDEESEDESTPVFKNKEKSVEEDKDSDEGEESEDENTPVFKNKGKGKAAQDDKESKENDVGNTPAFKNKGKGKAIEESDDSEEKEDENTPVRKDKGKGKAIKEPKTDAEEDVFSDKDWDGGLGEKVYQESMQQMEESQGDEDEIQPTQFRKAGGRSIYDEYSDKLIDGHEAGLDYLLETALDLKGMPCDGWVEKRQTSKGCTQEEFIYTLWLMMLSWDPLILKHFVHGNIAEEEKTSSDLKKRLKVIGGMSNTVVSPSTYVQYLTGPDGKSPPVKILYRILLLAERYSLGYDTVAGNNDDDELKESYKLAAEVDSALKVRDYKWGLASALNGERRYLSNDTQVAKCKAWIEAARERLEGLDPEEPLNRPWSEVGFAKKPRDRLDDHLRHQASNNLMNLVDAICRSQVGFTKFKISQFVVHKLVHHTHAMFDEILATRFALAYTAQGGGFSHHAAGISHAGADTVESGFYLSLQKSMLADKGFKARSTEEAATMRKRATQYIGFGQATQKMNQPVEQLNAVTTAYSKMLEEVKAEKETLIGEVIDETGAIDDYLSRRAARRARQDDDV